LILVRFDETEPAAPEALVKEEVTMDVDDDNKKI
jgi:hypothetical protein